MELSHTNKDKVGLISKMTVNLGEQANSSSLQIRDLDCLTTIGEVQDAIKRMKVSLAETNRRGLRMTIVQLRQQYC